MSGSRPLIFTQLWVLSALAFLVAFPTCSLESTVPTPSWQSKGADPPLYGPSSPPRGTYAWKDGRPSAGRGEGSTHAQESAAGRGHVRQRALLQAVGGRRQAGAFELSSMSSAQGFTVYGEQGQIDRVGVAVASGDVNGDLTKESTQRIMDVVIGAFNSGGAGNGAVGAGEVIVVFGKIDGWGSSIESSSLDGTNGFVIHGGELNDHAGNTVVTGDVNGDGYWDVVVGQHYGDGSAALDTVAVFVVFGKASGFAPSIHPSSLDGTNGFRVVGFPVVGFDLTDARGYSVGVIDLNGDGISDVAVGAPEADGLDNGAADAGQLSIVFGKASGFSADFDISTIDGSNGVTMLGKTAGDRFGWSLAHGDVTGDGLQDLIIGARWAGGVSDSSSKVGEVVVVFGSAGGWPARVDLSGINGNDGFIAYGVDAIDNAGWSVACGDVNGDGTSDIIIGAAGADGATNVVNQTGGVYVLFGKKTQWESSMLLSSLDGNNGFRVEGRDLNDWTGYSVGSGDVNGDGYSEVLIGAYNGGASANAVAQAGEVIVIYGQASGWGASVELSSMAQSQGFTIYGKDENDRTGWSVAAGDVNGDGFSDVIIGASGADGLNNNVNAGGEAYVVFGAPAALRCPRGQYDQNLDNQGPAVCVICPEGFHCSGVGSRIPCPSRFTTRPGAVALYNCTCSAEYVLEGTFCVPPTVPTTPPPITPAPPSPGPDPVLVTVAVLFPLVFCCGVGWVCHKTDQVRKFRTAFELRSHLKEVSRDEEGGGTKTAWGGGEESPVAKGGASGSPGSWRDQLGKSPSGYGRSLKMQQDGRVPISGGWKNPMTSPFKTTKVRSISPEAAAVNTKSPKSPHSPTKASSTGSYSSDRARSWAVVSPMARFMPPPQNKEAQASFEATYNTTPIKSPSHPQEVELSNIDDANMIDENPQEVELSNIDDANMIDEES